MHGSSTDGTQIGPHVVLAELGRGGMGAVYRVRHVETGAILALKVIHAPEADRAAEALARFRREVEVLARVSAHPGIVRIHGCGVQDGRPWATMEYVEGEPLSLVLARGPLSPNDSARTVIAIARAIAHAHRHEVIHRDLKPENVLVGRDGRPRVVDFGLALDDRARQLTRTGELLGTPAFMAPEQISRSSGSGSGAGSGDGGEVAAPIGPTTDVYGLGAVLYACLTGVAPFEGKTGVGLIVALMREDPPPPRVRLSSIPPEIEAICLRAIEKDQAARYPSADALADDLERWLAGDPTSVGRGAGRLRMLARRVLPADRRRRHLVVSGIAATGGVALLVAATGLGLSWRAHRERVTDQATADLVAELDATFAAACGGELEAIDAAIAAADRLMATGADDSVVRERREVALGLRKLARGDPVTVRTLDLGRAPWHAHRQAAVAVLAAGGATRELALLLEREPTLVDDSATIDLISGAVASGRAPATARLTAIIVDTLVTRIDDGGAGEDRRALAARVTAVIARRIEALIAADDPPDAAELDRLLGALLPVQRLAGGAAPLSPEAAVGLVTLTEERAGGLDREGLRSLGLLLEASLSVTTMPERQAERAREILDDLAHELAVAVVSSDDATRLRAFELGLLLGRLGALPVGVGQLAKIAPPRDEVERRCAAIIEQGVEPIGAADLGLIIAVERTRGIARWSSQSLAKSEASSAATLDLWPSITAILARESRAGDVPGWVLGEVANAVARSGIFDESRRVGERSDALLAKAGRALPPPPDDIPAPDDPVVALRDRIDALYDRAVARDAEAPRPRIELVVQALRWRIFTGRGASRGAVDLALAGLELGLDVEARWGDITTHDGVELIALVEFCDDVCRDLVAADPADAEPCATGETIRQLAVAAEAALPGGIYAPLYEARHAIRHGRVDEGLARFDAAITVSRRGRINGREETWPILSKKARILIGLGRLEQARATLDDDPGRGFRRGFHHEQRSDLRLQAGDLEGAEADRLEAIRLGARSP